MMNVGLPEVAFIAVLALIVVGPERLPQVARTAAQYLARFRQEAGRSVAELRAAADIDDVASEVSSLRAELRATKQELSRSLTEPRDAVREVVKEVSPGGPTARDVPYDDEEPPPVDPEAT